MPRLTESKGISVSVFVRIPQMREQRLFVWCCDVYVFSEKNRTFGRNLAFHSSLIIWGRFFMQSFRMCGLEKLNLF